MMGNYPTFLVREPDAGNPHVRFDEREVETEPQATAPPLDSTRWGWMPAMIGRPVGTIEGLQFNPRYIVHPIRYGVSSAAPTGPLNRPSGTETVVSSSLPQR